MRMELYKKSRYRVLRSSFKIALQTRETCCANLRAISRIASC